VRSHGSGKARRPGSRLTRWLLKGQYPERQGPYEQERQAHEHPWWQVMCLTGVDYFSTRLTIPPALFFQATEVIR
jgi:hypothetical protein